MRPEDTVRGDCVSPCFFREAGVSEEKSTEAAKAIADFDTRFAKLETDLLKLRADLLVLKWMVGLVIAAEVLPLLKTLFA